MSPRGQHGRRKPSISGFTEEEVRYIEGVTLYPESFLMRELAMRAWDPTRYRQQRLIQEAIERKRASGQA